MLDGELDSVVLQQVLNLLALLFDAESTFNNHNREQACAFENEAPPLAQPVAAQPYGWLVDNVNLFASKGGLQTLKTHIQALHESEALPAEIAIDAILVFKNATIFINSDGVAEFVGPVMDACVDVINKLTGKPLKDVATYLVQNEDALKEVSTAIKVRVVCLPVNAGF